MDSATRRQLTHETLRGYEHGPSAPERATAAALDKARNAAAVILVEGVSDQIAIECLAAKQGQDLDAERIVVVPVGGAHGVTRYLLQFGPQGRDLPLAGLCDTGEDKVYRRALARSGVGVPQTRNDMRQLGFHVCIDDLEDELIRAAGIDTVKEVITAQGDLNSFTTLQRQSAWRGRPVDEQMRRFLGAGARRKLRYAALLVEAMEVSRVPEPLAAVIADVSPLFSPNVNYQYLLALPIPGCLFVASRGGWGRRKRGFGLEAKAEPKRVPGHRGLGVASRL